MKVKNCLLIFLMVMSFLSCKKDVTTSTTIVTYNIQGLWIGTYTDSNNATLFHSFSIYPDGTMSYKSLGEDSHIYFATGTWTLSGTLFNYSVTTINDPTGIQHVQVGTAVFNNTSGTLTNGTILDKNNNSKSIFTLTRVN